MRRLTKKWQLFLYGFSGMGINMLNLIVGSYLCDALMVEGFDANVEQWTYLGITIVSAGVWSVLKTVAKIVDGVIDIPLANFTDNLKSRWGRRRPAILIGFVLTVVFYVALLFPVSGAEKSIGNTIWFGIMLCLFYTFYSLTMTTYYATFSEIVEKDEDRVVLSNFKTIFDIVYFVLGYALVPLFVGLHINIRIIGFAFIPLSLTMLIPLIMIKEKSTRDKDRTEEELEEARNEKSKQVGLFKSFWLTISNRPFLIWMLVYAFLQFGVQMFITGQNVLFSGYMGFNGIKITIVMACAFVPVPLFLLLYNKLVQRFGIKFGYVFSLIAYCISMGVMALCHKSIIPNETARIAVACIGALISSIGTGCFFSVAYTIPSAIANAERLKTGVSHPAMYFAVQGLVSGVATAISTGLVWVNIRTAGGGSLLWLMPVIVIAACLISLVITYFLPAEVKYAGKKVKLTDKEEK